MLASSLIKSFVSSTEYLRLYCTTFGSDLASLPSAGVAPPSRSHAENMARTMTEWATRLDAAGIQVHQEGAMARFAAAVDADAWGRPDGARAARAKTAGFYRAVLERAVELRGAHTFAIPAASHQGAWVASHEALAAATEFRSAQAAIAEMTAAGSARPELAAEADKLRATLGRSASMHQTACAEAASAWRAAEGGAWLRQVAKPEDVPVGPLVIGVEVWGGSPVLARLHGNLDPQHAGGVYGFGVQPVSGCLAACDAALSLREQGVVLPESTRYVTTRMDPDALVAAMLLSGRIPLELARTQLVRSRIGELALLDSGAPLHGRWVPHFLVQSVGDHKMWGPIANMCMQGAPLPDLEAAVLWTLQQETWIGAPGMAERASDVHYASMLEARNVTAGRFSVDGPIAYASGLPMTGGAWAACYSRAPIGVLEFARGGTRAFTVAACRDLGPQSAAFVRAFQAAANAADSDGKWAGASGITGSRGASRLSLTEVVAIARAQAIALGIAGSGEQIAPTTLH